MNAYSIALQLGCLPHVTGGLIQLETNMGGLYGNNNFFLYSRSETTAFRAAEIVPSAVIPLL